MLFSLIFLVSNSVKSAISAKDGLSRYGTTRETVLSIHLLWFGCSADKLDQSRWIESTAARVVPYRLSPCLAEIADFAEFWTKKIKLKSFKHQIFQCPQLYGGI